MSQKSFCVFEANISSTCPHCSSFVIISVTLVLIVHQSRPASEKVLNALWSICPWIVCVLLLCAVNKNNNNKIKTVERKTGLKHFDEHL